MVEQLSEWDLALILTLQGLGDWPVVVMNLFTFIGNREFYLLIMPALYWCWDRRLGLKVGAMFLLSTSLVILLKLAFHAPRPYWFDPQVRLLTEGELSFGMPSAHAQSAVVTWGIVAAHLRQRWAWLAAVFLMVMIGLSRVWLGVHYTVDIIAGWLLGGVILLLFFRFERPVGDWVSRWGIPAQIALVLMVSLGLTFLGMVIRNNITVTWQLPSEWLQNVAIYNPDDPLNPLSLDDLISSAAAFFGLAAGAILLEPYYDFSMAGPWRQRLGRYAIGVVGILILWQGLGGVFDLLAPPETLLADTLRYLRYSLVGLWISALAPLLFMRVGLLAGKDRPLKPVPNL